MNLDLTQSQVGIRTAQSGHGRIEFPSFTSVYPRKTSIWIILIEASWYKLFSETNLVRKFFGMALLMGTLGYPFFQGGAT